MSERRSNNRIDQRSSTRVSAPVVPWQNAPALLTREGAPRIGVLMGGRSEEREISLKSGAAVAQALEARGWDIVPLDIGDSPCAQITAARLDAAFIALHGGLGEDGSIQGLLEAIGLPYTGSGVLASALAMDKIVSKQLFQHANLPTPRWIFPVCAQSVRDFGFPVLLKPRAGGSSIGIQKLADLADFDAWVAAGASESANSALMAEAYIPGRELSVAVLGEGEASEVLGSVEIRTHDGIYDQSAKYERGDTVYEIPAPLEPKVRARVAQIALDAHRLLECSGVSRADLRWSGASQDAPMLLEVNTVPGLTERSLLPKIAQGRGLSYGELVEFMLQSARLKS